MWGSSAKSPAGQPGAFHRLGVLFASHPILSLAESFTAAARHHCHAVRCELVRTGAEELVETCLTPDLPPSPRGFLRVRFAGDVARAAALLLARELDEHGQLPWLPDDVELHLDATWNAPGDIEAEDVEPESRVRLSAPSSGSALIPTPWWTSASGIRPAAFPAARRP